MKVSSSRKSIFDEISSQGNPVDMHEMIEIDSDVEIFVEEEESWSLI